MTEITDESEEQLVAQSLHVYLYMPLPYFILSSGGAHVPHLFSTHAHSSYHQQPVHQIFRYFEVCYMVRFLITFSSLLFITQKKCT